MNKYKDLQRVIKTYYPIIKDQRHLGVSALFLYVLGSIMANVISPLYFKAIIDSVVDLNGNPWHYFGLFVLLLIAMRAAF